MDGMSFTMNLQYAAGHTGTFEMAYSCAGTTENDMANVRCSHWASGLLPSTRNVGAGVGGWGGVRGRGG